MDACHLYMDEELSFQQEVVDETFPIKESISLSKLPLLVLRFFATAVNSSRIINQKHVLPDAESFISWLFSYLSMEELQEAWMHRLETRRNMVNKIDDALKNQDAAIKSLCERRYELLCRVEAVREVGRLCAKEYEDRKQPGFAPQVMCLS